MLHLLRDALFLTQLTKFVLPGAVRRRLDLASLPNIDGEEPARDSASRLYVGAFGNSRSQRRELAIFLIS